MKKRYYALVYVFVGAAFYAMAGCSEKSDAQAAAEAAFYRKRAAQEMAATVEYARDPRTGLCFAYKWDGMANGGPAFANVPCTDAVQKLLSN